MNVTLRRAVLAALAAALHGCATSAPSAPALVLKTAQMPAWLDAGALECYRCEEGLLTCEAVGRAAKRFCRCE